MSTPQDSIRILIAGLSERLAIVQRKKELLELSRRSLIAMSGALAVAFLTVVAEVIGYLPSDARTLLSAAYVFAVLPAAIAFCLPPVLRLAGILSGESVGETARWVGARFPQVRDRLLNILQFGVAREHHAWVSSELIEESVRTLSSDLEGVDLASSLDWSPVRETARRSGWTVLALMAISFVWPSSFFGGFHRLWEYDKEFVRPRTFSFVVAPGNTEAAKGTDVSLQISVEADGGPGRIPDRIQLFLRGEGQTRFEAVELRASAAGVFTHEVSDIRYSYDYYAATEAEQSGIYRIEVIDWPSLQSFRVRLDPPAYARLPVIQQEEFAGDIAALAGTRVRISGRSSKELTAGEIRFADSSVVPLSVHGLAFEGTFTAERPTSYTLRIHDAQGLSNRSPIAHQVRITPDAPPAVVITQPGRNIDIAGSEPVALFIEASDDFGVSSLTLRYRLSHSRYVPVTEAYLSARVPVPGSAPRDVQTSYRWDLQSLDLVPEDVVEYFVEVSDNDAISGPKTSRSQVYTLRLPSLEEVFADAESGHEQALENLDTSLEEAEQLRKDIEEIHRDLKTNKEFDWQDQQKAEEMAKKVEDIRKRLDQTEQQLKAMTDEMQRQQVLSPETLEKYLELQNLFQEMNSQELQQALRQMQQAMQNVRKDQLRQAIEQVEFSEERFRQGIERTLNLLKRIQIEQRMDEATRRAESLAAEQEDIQESAPQDGARRAEDQEELAEGQKQLESLLQDLQRSMEEFFTEMPADELSRLNRDLQQQGLQQQMAQAAQQMRQGQPQEARRSQQQIQQSLENLAQQLQQMQEQMLENQAERILNALRRATTDLLELSQRQEQVKNDAQSSPANSAELRENAQRQMQLMSELNNIAANLSELAQKSFAVTPEMGRALGEAMQSMQQAMRDLDVRNGAQAAQDQTSAMASLNKGAQQVQQSLEAMMQGAQGSPGGMGLMQQLQMMAGQQMQLNAQTRRMGEGGMEEMQRAAEAARIAREQDAVRKSLEQLQREARSSGEQERILGDLDRIAGEMREVVRNLEQNNANDQTIRQQERILSRLLDASRSMRERDFEKRREATTGRRITRRGPESLPTEDTKNWLRQEMLRALERGYSRDYQDLIRKYFEELERATAGSD